jgi:AcrR family transcriptional regulator
MIHPFHQFTNALKINKSSFYSAFGNKKNLFNQAIDLYSNKYRLVHTDELSKMEIELPERIRNFLLSIARMITSSNLPTGCLLCSSTSEIAGNCLPDNATKNSNAMNQKTIISLTDFLKKNDRKEI